MIKMTNKGKQGSFLIIYIKTVCNNRNIMNLFLINEYAHHKKLDISF